MKLKISNTWCVDSVIVSCYAFINRYVYLHQLKCHSLEKKKNIILKNVEKYMFTAFKKKIER